MGCFSVTLPPDYAEMGSTRTNKCISTDQAQEKGLDKSLISSQHQGNSQNATRTGPACEGAEGLSPQGRVCLE